MAVERIGSIIRHLNPGSSLNSMYVTSLSRLLR
jgi:hypothetical protein